MNSKHKNIEFTFEAENLNSFSYKNVKIIPQIKRFITSFFWKATFNVVFTNYDFLRFCRGVSKFYIKLERLRSIFICNNYLVDIIEQCIKKFFGQTVRSYTAYTNSS